jgi:hypothetical protein
LLVVIILLIVGFLLWRIVTAIRRAFSAVTIISSWGLVLGGLAGQETEVIERVHAAQTTAKFGHVSWKTHSDGFFATLVHGRHVYSAVQQGSESLQALTGVHRIGTDLFVSWNLMSRVRPSLNPAQAFGLNSMNRASAFASATLAVTQQVVTQYALEGGQKIDPSDLKAHGLLGPIPPTVEARRPEPAPTSEHDDV